MEIQPGYKVLISGQWHTVSDVDFDHIILVGGRRIEVPEFGIIEDILNPTR